MHHMSKKKSKKKKQSRGEQFEAVVHGAMKEFILAQEKMNPDS